MSTPVATQEPLRLAIFATPRMGNTWFRALLKSVYRLEDVAVHNLADVDWNALPQRTVVNLHHPPSPAILEKLEGWRTLVIARHPLDTLISILHHASHHRNSNDWAGGLGGNEDGIREATPISPEFIEYAVGPRAAALMSISAGWWQTASVIRVQYESLRAETETELRRVVSAIDAPPLVPLEEAIAACSFDVMRVRSQTHLRHAWKAEPGLWKMLFPAATARRIAEALADVFGTLGYQCDPDEGLSETQAWSNWLAMGEETHRRDKAQLWDLLNAARQAAAESENRAAEASQRYAESESRRHALADQLARLDAMLKSAHNDLAKTQAHLSAEQEQKRGLVERLVQADGLLREQGTQLAKSEGVAHQAKTRVVELHTELSITQERLAEAERRHGEALQSITRLAADLEALRAEADAYWARLSGVSPLGLKVGRRLTRLTQNLPWQVGHVEPPLNDQRAA